MNDDPPTTLETLMFHWDDAYIFAYARDRWIAIRRDGLMFLAADTLTQLEAEIEFDYGNNPVLYEGDCLDAVSDYLTADPGSQPECTDDLLALFPDWDIEYSEQMRGWIAQRKGATIWENSPLDIRIALTLIEQKQEHGGTGSQERPQPPDGP
jgi:hypothetical protein